MARPVQSEDTMSDHSNGPSFYQVGSVIAGRTYLYTGLGTFPTPQAAGLRCVERRAIVYEQHEVIANGIAYGLSELVPVASCVGA